VADFSNNQGVINGRITRLANNPKKLKEFMQKKSPEQQRLGRIHYKMVQMLRKKAGKRAA
jgi:hypothetical protein